MLSKFYPNVYVERYTALNVEKLKQQGITLLLCDIDNTLVAHDEALPNEEVIAFVQRVQAAGIAIVLVSNNKLKRVQTFAEALGLPYYAFAKKPLKQTYRQILKDLQVEPKHIAAFGDQLLTDVLGANRMGIYPMLTKPLVIRDLNVTKINRSLENFVFFLLKRTHALSKGEYYD
ncbi:MAG: YqeG family HAD IIIA-type phosphatase [Erysipelotrichaceae bacterium]